MKRLLPSLLALLLFSAPACLCAADAISLPAPQKSGGMPLLDAISARQSSRNFADTELTPEQLSTLLWVAGGVNRADGKLTYGTAMNLQDMILFVFTRSGTYRYDPAGHCLTLVKEGDHRALTGTQPFVAKAAADLVYVQDMGKWKALKRKAPEADILNCGFSHAGLSMQNVYLYAASQGWGAVTRLSFDKQALGQFLGLNPEQKFTLMICVGPRQ